MNGIGATRKMASKKVTIQQHLICFVIGLLMYEPVHFAGLFLAYEALLNSYVTCVLAFFRH